MKKNWIVFLILYFAVNLVSFSQVDTTYIYNSSTPYGSLDIRIAKSATDYYYLQENKTFSYRESAPGVRTNTFKDMTVWDSSPYKEGNLRQKTASGDNFIMNYRMLIPQGYNPSYPDGYPIIFAFHGYGERGNCDTDKCYHATPAYSPNTNTPPAPTTVDHELMNNDHNLLHGGRPYLSAVNIAGTKLPNDPGLSAKGFPGFILFPQNLNGWNHFAVQDAIRLLRLIIKKYNINENRVYIQGLSNGGHGLYEAIKRAPWLFAAALPMSAIDDGFIGVQGMAPKIAHIPLWIFQGGLDINPNPKKTQRYIQNFRSAGSNVRFTLYPELGHGTWNKAFREPDYYTWMLGKNKSDIHSFENTTVICSAEGTKLELGEGFKAYQWQFNGQVIAGATSAIYFAKTPGTYKARFSRISNPTEAQWNPWSAPVTLTVGNPPTASISQTGTVLLNDLNDYANARLESSEMRAHYYWYKDGVLLDFPGNQDDTLQAVTLTPTYGNGAYTLVVSDLGCKSAPSSPKNVFFNNLAPVNIADPLNFTGSSTSASEITLTWKDNAANENGFEIWRRKKISDTGYSPWEMATLTAANVGSYIDIELEPSVTYQYKIRAVSSVGRSNYIPGSVNEGLVIKTNLDTQKPTAPSNLTVVPKGVQTLLLSWKPSSDNTQIKEYYIYFNKDSVSTSSADTTFRLTNLALNTNFDIWVKGVDVSRNFSPASNKVKASTYFSGFYYEHSTGSWTQLDSIDWSTAEFTGVVKNITLSPKTQDDFFNFKFDGFLYIEKGGSYQFRMGSDDGSRLSLNNTRIIDNDGIHEFKTVTSEATNLTRGPQRITIEFFESTQSDTLLVEYKGPDTGNGWTRFSRDVLKSDESIITAVGPDNGPEDSFLVSVYPNPTTHDNIHIQVQTVINMPLQIRLIDPMGRYLFERVYQPEEVSQGVNIAAAGVMNTGIYIVMVKQGTFTTRQKVIIRR